MYKQRAVDVLTAQTLHYENRIDEMNLRQSTMEDRCRGVHKKVRDSEKVIKVSIDDIQICHRYQVRQRRIWRYVYMYVCMVCIGVIIKYNAVVIYRNPECDGKQSGLFSEVPSTITVPLYLVSVSEKDGSAFVYW